MRRRMDRLVPLLVFPFLLQTTLAQAASCAETLKLVEQLYSNTVDECKGANGEPNPASDCSGLLVRGTQRPEENGGKAGDYFVWNDSKGVKDRGATAVTYMREDIVFDDIVVYKDQWRNYNSGIILTPVDHVAPGEAKPHVLCVGPADLWADERDDKGCGDNQKTPEVEKSCQESGVDGSNWVDKHFIQNMTQNTELIGGKSCSFSLQNMSNAERTKAFKEFLKARRAMQNVANQDTAFTSYTEARVPSTEDNTRSVLAFFYSDDSALDGARQNQQEYKTVTGKDVPVIKITYPKDKYGKATFSCATDSTDTPVKPEDLNATDKVAGGWGTGDDPKKCTSYIQSAVWISRKNYFTGEFEKSLSVTPTDCGREIGADQTAAAFGELEAKGKAAPNGLANWADRTDTIRRQFVCHLVLEKRDDNGNVLPVRYKQEYNLEPRRPPVSHEQSLRDDCNSEVADPVSGGGGSTPGQCPEYIKSAKWVERTDFPEYPNRAIQSLEVVYNDCAKGFGADKTAAVMKEMERKAIAASPRGAEYWGNKTRSMTLQAICLAKNFPDKSPHYLESIRPDEATLADVEKMNCNHYKKK